MFRPVNGYVWVERPIQEKEEMLVYVPSDYSPKDEQYIKLEVLSLREDNPLNIKCGDFIVTREAVIEDVQVGDRIYSLVSKNHIFGVLNEEN